MAAQPAPSRKYSRTAPAFVGPFYPSFTGRERAESDTLLSLLDSNVASEVDFDALNVFLRIETFIGTDTAFRDIKADAPDYGWVNSITALSLSRVDVIDTYIDLFSQAIQRCHANADTTVALSGGQDSRHILLELCRQGRPPRDCWTVDFPWKKSESELASLLCERLKLSHRTFQLPGNLPAIESVKNRLTDFSSLQHGWMAAAVIAGFAKGGVLFDGIGGDVLSAGLFLSSQRLALLAENRIDELVEDLVGPREHIFGVKDSSLFPRSRALEKVSEEFRKHLGAPDPISSFFFWNRTRRDIGCSPFRLLQQGFGAVHTPYLDPDLMAFLAAIPPAMTVDHNLHADVIARAYPDFEDVPYAQSDKAGFVSGVPYFRRLAAHTLRYLVPKRSPMLRCGKIVAQLVRCLLSPKHTPEAYFLAPRIVYLTELFGTQAG